MKKIKAVIACIILLSGSAVAQTISIAAARALPAGSSVTVSGIVLNGPELGSIRYMQDGTGGIGVFSPSVASADRGDIITVTGITDDYFNLLEINPVISWGTVSTGNPLPSPSIITPSLLDEPLESQLVQINNATFSNPGGNFAGNATYSFTAAAQPGIIYLRANSPLVGTPIPASNVTLTGICSQNNTAYQLLPRDINDITPTGSISFTVPPAPLNITTTGLDIAWETNIAGSTYIEYGSTAALGSTLSGTGGTTSHLVSITGAVPSEVFYARAFSVAGSDTAFSDTRAFITASGSSGTITAYFNRSVDHAVASSPSNTAMQLNSAIDDTLKAYMDRCMSTMDIAIYNFDINGTATIIQAINDAYSRGVQIRIISDGSNNNAGLPSLNGNIQKISSPVIPTNYYGFMHNKFVVMDAADSDPDVPVVWTGSTNWSNDQLNTDANNVIIIQDKSLAKAYTMEFEEMWGGTGPAPNIGNSRFGPDKTDNTPHEFIIGGRRVENYFSPSDQVNNQIIRTISTADAQLFFSTFVFTRYDIAFAVEQRVVGGVLTGGIIDDTSNGGGYPFSIMHPVMNNNLIMYDHASLPGILHHKYMIADQHNASLDPLVLTGSHNWSNAANLRNDENTVIVHDADIANQFYQEFYKRFTESGGTIGVLEQENADPRFLIYPNPSTEYILIAFDGSVQETIRITVTGIGGNKIHAEIYQTSGSQRPIRINTGEFTPGIYFVSLEGKSGTAHGKFIIH